MLGASRVRLDDKKESIALGGRGSFGGGLVLCSKVCRSFIGSARCRILRPS